MDIQRHARGVTFRVSEKSASDVCSRLKNLHDAFTSGSKGEPCGEILMSSPNDRVIQAPTSNGLVDTVVAAYSHHHNVELTPDHFWVSVLTQFSQFVNANSKLLRDKFVDFHGAKELKVSAVGGLRSAPYDEMAVSMTDEIAAHLRDQSVREWVLPSFSTTTHTDRVVCSVVLMAALKTYFTYKFELLCGIPSVTLVGTPADYEDLARRVDRLPEFDAGTGLMIKWHQMLKPIFVELVSASRGSPDLSFWSRVCSHHSAGSGTDYISGWIASFCCFSDKGEWQGEASDDALSDSDSGFTGEFPLVNTVDIPCGVVSVPVTIDDNGELLKARMIAGSLGADLVDCATLKPRLDWCLALLASRDTKEHSSGTSEAPSLKKETKKKTKSRSREGKT